MKAPLPRYTLHIGPHGDDARGLLQDPAGNTVARFPFSVNEANRYGMELRAKAQAWANAVADGDANHVELWRQLHECGVKCFNFIFRSQRKLVEETLASAVDGARVWVNQTSLKLRMPWGLLCNPQDVDVLDVTPALPLLWGGKYNLTISMDDCGCPSERKSDPWSFAAVLCRPTYQRGIDLLPAAAVPIAKAIRDRSIDPVNLSETRRTLSNCFLYVHSHAEAGDLAFERVDGKKSRIPLLDLVDSLVVGGGAAIAILNACETVNSVCSLGATLALSPDKEVASIATEIQVHERFAMEFGLELIDRCVQRGESTIDALMAMRRKHYPLSVVYTHYCMGELTAEPPLDVFDAKSAEAYRLSIVNTNYSDHVRGQDLQ